MPFSRPAASSWPSGETATPRTRLERPSMAPIGSPSWSRQKRTVPSREPVAMPSGHPRPPPSPPSRCGPGASGSAVRRRPARRWPCCPPLPRPAIWPSGANATPSTQPVWPASVRIEPAVAGPPEAGRLVLRGGREAWPSGENATPVTTSSWPRSVARSAPSAVLQMRAVLSAEAAATRWPSGENATPRTTPSWPPSVRTAEPSARLPEARRLVGAEPESRNWPSGAKVTLEDRALVACQRAHGAPSATFQIRIVPSPVAAAISSPSGENAASATKVPVSRKRTSARLSTS